MLLEGQEAYPKLLTILADQQHKEGKWKGPYFGNDNILFDTLFDGELRLPTREQSTSLNDNSLPKVLRVLKGESDSDVLLAGMLSARESATRQLGLNLIRQQRSSRHFLSVVDLLQDQDLGVRAVARRTFTQLDLHGRVPELRALLRGPKPEVRKAAAIALALQGDTASAPAIESLLGEAETAGDAIRALGLLKQRKYALAFAKGLNPPEIDESMPRGTPTSIDGLWDSDPSGALREPFDFAIENLGPADPLIVGVLLEPIYSNIYARGYHRFLSHYVGGGNELVETMLTWVGKPKAVLDPAKLSRDEARNAILQPGAIVPLARSSPSVLDDVAKQIAALANKGAFREDDTPALLRGCQEITGTSWCSFVLYLWW